MIEFPPPMSLQRFVHGTLALSIRHRRFNRTYYRSGDVVLDGENVCELPIESFGPDVRAGSRLNQLRRDTQTSTEPPYAAFKHIAHAQFAADLFNVERTVLKSEA